MTTLPQPAPFTPPQIRREIHERSERERQKFDLEDLVIEDVVPDIGDIGAVIAGLFAPRRPLKPVRRERKKVGGQTLTSVQVVGHR